MSIGIVLLAGLGLWLLVEGLIYLMAPAMMQRLAAMIAGLPIREIALAGGLTALIGAVLLAIAVATA
jgi:uncharacterized protein YjeT (DUF2065 family)